MSRAVPPRAGCRSGWGEQKAQDDPGQTDDIVRFAAKVLRNLVAAVICWISWRVSESRVVASCGFNMSVAV